MSRLLIMDLKQTYERSSIHESWESVYRDNPWQDRLNAIMLDRILKVMKPATDARFLDAGCGVGYHTLALAGRGFRCVGVDISETILEKARENAVRMGLQDRVVFQSGSLEKLEFADATFDMVHCRGVLMHIPRWQDALAELCRVLKPGGKIVIIEANSAALETRLVRLARWLTRRRSELVRTSGGLEFWAEQDGVPFLVRIAHLPELARTLEANGVQPVKRLATEFWDIYRFRAGWCRNLAIHFNRLWFRCRLPARLSMGNAIIGAKACRAIDLREPALTTNAIEAAPAIA